MSGESKRYEFNDNPTNPISPDLDFLEQLALVVFGSKRSVPLFKNPRAVLFQYRNTIRDAIHTINSTDQEIGDSAVEVAFNHMKLLQDERFDLISISRVNNLPTLQNYYTYENVSATNTSGSGSSATFDFIIEPNDTSSNGDISYIAVNTKGNNYTDGDIITIDLNSIYDIYYNQPLTSGTITISYNSSFSNMFNSGTFDWVGLPFIIGDSIQFIIDVTTSEEQRNASGNLVSMNRTCLIDVVVVQNTSENYYEYSTEPAPEIDLGPFAINGYYPLYSMVDDANNAGNGTSHSHVFDGITYYMPNGVTYYHGNYYG